MINDDLVIRVVKASDYLRRKAEEREKKIFDGIINIALLGIIGIIFILCFLIASLI